MGSIQSSSGGNIGGSIRAGLPKRSWNGMNPVDALIVFINLNRTVGSAWTQPFWSHSTANRMHWITILFVRLLAPSVSGWYAVDIFSFIPVSLCNSFQKWDRKSLSRSDTISRGRPFSQYQCLKNRCAISSAVNVVVVGMMRILDPRWSVNVMMLLWPPSGGNGPMKSIATESQWLSGMGSGCSGPIGFDVFDLFHWHSAQDGTYAISRSFRMFGQ